jgi:hypothetical protein
LPTDDAFNVCRNPLVNITFDQEMEIGSFTGNVIVVGDYGSSVCPPGTVYLVKEDNSPSTKLVRLYKGIVQKLKEFIWPLIRLAKLDTILTEFSPDKIIFSAQAYGLTPTAGTTYCAISGRVSGRNNAGTSDLYFTPNQALDIVKDYYVIIKGDPDLTDGIVEGVRNTHGVGLNSSNSPAGSVPANITFNGISYPNSYIWTFRTGNLICQLQSITIDPPSKLFQRAFDTTSFTAYSWSAAGQAVAPTLEYNWTWSWRVENPAVAVNSGSVTSVEQVTAQDRKDASTKLWADAYITVDVINNPPTVGQTKSGSAPIYVFICENPWPPMGPGGTWGPWSDQPNNCGGPPCNGFNINFYYCRDAGQSGTSDDIPAIASSSVILPPSAGLTCSDGSGSTDCPTPGSSIGDPCGTGSGTCVNKLLKEFYFFREAVPSIGASTIIATDQLDGGHILVQFSEDLTVDGYKLYWGTVSGNYTDYIAIDSMPFASANVTCSASGGTVSCDVINLNNGTTYYFAYTTYFNTGAESGYSLEDDESPSDQTVPATAPTITGATSSDSEAILSWQPTTPDTVSYKVYVGTSPGSYGSAQDVGNDTAVIVGGLTNGTSYYFAVTALDSYGNESTPVSANEVSLQPFAAPRNLVAVASTTDNTVITLGWELSGGGVTNVNIYWGDAPGTYNGATSPIVIPGSPTPTLFSVTGLTPGTAYYFALSTNNSLGEESVYTNEAGEVTNP